MKPTDLSTEQLVDHLERLNAAYRAGEPEVSDHEFDHVWVAALREREPDHPFLSTVQADGDGSSNKIRHPSPMLSTEKAYETEAIGQWYNRGVEAAARLGVESGEVLIRVTPKLDGVAGRDDGAVLATRGDGIMGQDVSHIFDLGVVPVGGRGHGVGEIVVEQAYFERELQAQHDLRHPRNYVAGLIGADTIRDYHTKALEAGAVRFVPFSEVPARVVSFESLQDDWQSLVASASECGYATDGVVAELWVEDSDKRSALRDALGATSHHHRAVLALKVAGERKAVKVIDVSFQTGRTSRITPVLHIEPTELSGAVVQRITAHTAAMLRDRGLGVGAVIEAVRSGEVIPFIAGVLEPSQDIPSMDHCPSCGHKTRWANDYLECANVPTDCPAQGARVVEHFMKITNILGFGPKVCEQLREGGYSDPVDVLEMDTEGFESVGISPGVAKNLEAAISDRKAQPLRDYMLLAAFGFRHAGRGDSKKILAEVAIDSLSELTTERLAAIKGFGEGTSALVSGAIQANLARIDRVLSMGFAIERTALTNAVEQSPTKGGALVGKKVVFTGACSLSRDEMRDEAEAAGLISQSSVSAATDYLVCGEKVGASKMAKAEKLGAAVVSEAEYRELLSGSAETVAEADDAPAAVLNDSERAGFSQGSLF